MRIDNLSDCYKLSKLGEIITIDTQRSGVVIGIEPYDKNIFDIISKKHKTIDVQVNEVYDKFKYKHIILLSEISKDEDKFWFKDIIKDKTSFLFDKLRDFATDNVLIRNHRDVNDFVKASIDIICNKAGIYNINRDSAVKTVIHYMLVNEPDNLDLISYAISTINILISGNLKVIKEDIFKDCVKLP